MKKLFVVILFILISLTSIMAALNDASDGTITDNITNLVWTKCSLGKTGIDCSVGAANSYWWDEAITACENLNLAGSSDWRLPNVKELQSLIVYNSDTSPRINNIFNIESESADYFYWTSTTVSDGDNFAWLVKFKEGVIQYRHKNESARPDQQKGFVLCVRTP